METNLALDDALIQEVLKLGSFESKKAAVTQVLLEYVQRHKRAEIIKLFGTVEYDENYDHKEGRN